MEFEWDEAKRQTILSERGIDLLYAARIFDGPVTTEPDPVTTTAKNVWFQLDR